MSKIAKKILPIAGAVIGNTLLPGAGAAIGSGFGTLASGGGIKNALLSGVGSYAGGQIAGNIFGNAGSTVGNAIGLSSANALPWAAADTTLGSALGRAVGSTAANSIAGTSLASVFGSQAGSDLATNAFGDNQANDNVAPAGPAPFMPKQADQQALPSSLNSYSSLTGDQQSSNLATQGVYGGGIGPEEQSYFLNLANRKLVDQSGNTSDMSSLSPIEQAYLQKLGLGGYGNTSSLLEAISKWKSAA